MPHTALSFIARRVGMTRKQTFAVKYIFLRNKVLKTIKQMKEKQLVWDNSSCPWRSSKFRIIHAYIGCIEANFESRTK